MSGLTDPGLVCGEYETEKRHEARASVYRWAEGPDAIEMCVQAVASVENGEGRLRRHFRTVERRDASGTVRFADRAAAEEYVDASITLLSGQLPADFPQPFDGTLTVRRAPCVFVADR